MRLSVTVIFFLFSTIAFAQRYQLPDSVGVFGQRVKEMLSTTNNVKTSEIGSAFEEVWASGFNASQKDKIIKLSRKMLRDEVAIYPLMTNYFSMLTSAVSNYNLASGKMDNLLIMVEKSYEAYGNRTFSVGLLTLRNLFVNHALFYSRNNALYVEGAGLDFEFKEMSTDYESVSIDDALLNELTTADEAAEEATEDGWGDSGESDSWGDSKDDDGWGDDDWENDSWNDDGWGEPKSDDDSGWSDGQSKENEISTADQAIKSGMEAVVTTHIKDAQGAIIKFEKANLTFVTRYDSTSVENTSGEYEFHNFRLIANGGKFKWDLAGFDGNDVYTELDKYSFDTRLPEFRAEKTKQYYKVALKDKVEGIFEYKSVKRDSLGNAAYPKFNSYHSDIKYNFDYDGFYFRGGFSLDGRKAGTESIDGADAMIEVSGDKGKQFRGYGKDFVFKDTVVLGKQVRIAVYHSRDSITHPSVRFYYYPNQKRLTVRKEKDGFNLSPYNSSYYDMTIEADMVDWDLNADSMNISVLNAKSMIPATFESIDYFSKEKLEEMSGVYKFNPVVAVFSYGSKNKTREFYADDMVADLKLNEKAVHSAMMFLWYRGFIDYDPDLRKVFIKDKLIHYVRSRRKSKDYDELLISSLSRNAPNATLHLADDALTVRGIDKFYISETQDIYILPFDNSITILKDRDFTFQGQLFAGNFEFGGRNFMFKYDSFLVDLGNIDSIKFKVEDENFRKKEVDNKLVSVELFKGGADVNASTSGTLYINKPNNKSGNMIYPEYPIFNAARGAVVYFDQEDILDGAYDKSMYFYIPPFGIDSLSAEDPAAIGFEGIFMSEGMFPDFKETLHIMPDNSLGFEHNTPPEGYNLYEGDAKFYNKLRLDKNGLVASGRIEYISSSSQSEAYTFYQDSVIAEGTDYIIESGTYGGASFPQISTPTYDMKWYPREDEMFVYNKEEPFDLYNTTASLDGATILTAQGVHGEGLFKARGFEAVSDEFTFQETKMTARHSNFVVASPQNPEKPLMQGEDIRLDFDLTNNLGDLSPEVEGVAALEFPYAQVKTSISKARWNLAEEKVYMEKPEDVDISNSYFYTTREELDSLAFNATGATYDLQRSELLVTGIPYINVADALITPENNEVLILENATIGTLLNTNIVIDSSYQYHNLFDGTINIISSKQFSGDATYQLVNAVKDTFAIKFEEFNLREVPDAKNKELRGLQTVSGGTIRAEDNLVISPGMLFKGDVTMFAQQKPLKLDGYVKLDFKNSENYDTWIKYQSQDEETQEIIFDIATAVTENGNLINAGLHYEAFSNELYLSFVQDRRNVSDDDFFKPKGQLWFDESVNKYTIMDSAKANGNSYAGDVFTYNENNGDIEFEGNFHFINNYKETTMRSAGRGTGNARKQEYKANTLSIFDFDLPDAAFAEMHRHVFETVDILGAPESEPDKDALIFKMAPIIGDRETVGYDQRSLEEYIPIAMASNRLIGDIVFSKLVLDWDKDKSSWYSEGQLGLSHIVRNDVNAMVDGFVEIKKTENGSALNLFIQVSADCWYYFGFEENKLVAFSNNEAFNDIVGGKSKIDKAGFGEYVFVLGDKSDALNFVNQFRADYLGISEPYEMYVPEPTPQQNFDFLETEEEAPVEGESITEEELIQEEEKQEEVIDDNEGF